MTEVATIVDIIRLKEQGLSKRAIAKRLGISRDTVSKYWEGELTNLKPPSYNKRSHLLDPYRDYITQRLEKYPELSAKRIFTEIKSKGYQGSDRTVRRYLQDHRPRQHRELKPFETLPGEQAQVDWGHFGSIVINGARYKLYAFVFTLGWSRVSYVEFVVSTNLASFLSSLHRALEYIGGVPREIVFDNAKVVVSERVGEIIRFNENLLHAALMYGFTPHACWAFDAESKGKVESQVKYVRNGFYYGLEYDDIFDLNRQARQWLDQQANPRIHGTTKEVPFQRLQQEKSHLKPFRGTATSPFILGERRATRTSLISVDGNHYSVPYRYARGKVHFRRYENHLELLDNNQVIDTIVLQYGKGQRFIRDEHYPEHQKHKHTPSHPLQAKFEALAPEAKYYLQNLNRSRVGNLREQMKNIISLSEQYSEEAFSQAMQRAHQYNAFGYNKLKNILALQAKAPGSLPENNNLEATLPAEFDINVEQRDLAYYAAEGGAQ